MKQEHAVGKEPPFREYGSRGVAIVSKQATASDDIAGWKNLRVIR
jgi:hypothetical protein